MKNVQDIYPVSPMQELMLLHSLSQPDVDTLFHQFQFDISGAFDPDAFQDAWQSIVDRHPALRTGFIWRDINKPLQVVRKSITNKFRIEDLRGKDSETQRADIDDYLRVDRQTGFDLARSPLMRFCLLQLADDRWRFVWSSHHLVIDRWCLGQIYRELDRFYDPSGTSTATGARNGVPGFKEYVSWLLQQDKSVTLEYWSRYLQGYQPAGRLVDANAGTRPDASSQQTADILIDAEAVSALERYARNNAVTTSVIAQAAWALTLNNVLEAQDVIFGATVSGRPATIPDIESIVGSFINNVPVRVRLPRSEQVSEWLGNLQAQQFARSSHEYVSGAELKRELGAEEHCLDFESLLVWLAGVGETDRIDMRPVPATVTTAYPLTVSLNPEPGGLHVWAVGTKSCVRGLQDLLDTFSTALKEIVHAAPGTTLGELRVFAQQPGFDEAPDVAESGDTESSHHYGSEDAAHAEAGRGRERLGTDLLREVVQAEWSTVLQDSEFDGDSDFFGLGGTSLQAAQLHARLETAMRSFIPMLALFENPTLDGMVATLHAGDWPVRPGLVNRVRAGRRSTQLFCIASPEVNTVGYSLLTRYLDEDQGVYVLQSPPEHDRVRQMHPGELTDLATRYLGSLRRLQPQGPYRLLAMCGGSHIALEMARQLEAKRERVEFCGIINTWAQYSVSRLYYLERMINILRYYRSRVRGLVPSFTFRRAEQTAGKTLPAASTNFAITPETEVGLRNPWIADVGFAARNPDLPKLATRVTVFRIKNQPYWRVQDKGLGWSIHFSDVEPVHVSGRYHTKLLREPYIEEIASAINDRLR